MASNSMRLGYFMGMEQPSNSVTWELRLFSLFLYRIPCWDVLLRGMLRGCGKKIDPELTGACFYAQSSYLTRARTRFLHWLFLHLSY